MFLLWWKVFCTVIFPNKTTKKNMILFYKSSTNLNVILISCFAKNANIFLWNNFLRYEKIEVRFYCMILMRFFRVVSCFGAKFANEANVSANHGSIQPLTWLTEPTVYPVRRVDHSLHPYFIDLSFSVCKCT